MPNFGLFIILSENGGPDRVFDQVVVDFNEGILEINLQRRQRSPEFVNLYSEVFDLKPNKWAIRRKAGLKKSGHLFNFFG